jgi:hypothetical protein
MGTQIIKMTQPTPGQQIVHHEATVAAEGFVQVAEVMITTRLSAVKAGSGQSGIGCGYGLSIHQTAGRRIN